ncbi:tRNA dihydrouridine(20/20a) synthase DusA [Hyphobacterium marinum]|uniref:tRNA-dihydrouridine(20/20a) synthase n=1 Tax=Hyphobacterium marinum TaxID=3116574 RepID=A0ABU7M0J2_9PROT|nr:tRNA dihydrouridine(20/20a) synthase DusA [Hyphobacterium sp. Y6023]MEE2567298.1 tRNA dihydrouridine(20/20a) synthase DusA [Hyphobacterium sp. Y6023]
MNTNGLLDRRMCVAPMMDWTDRHCRAFHRVLTRRAVLYTEMATSPAVVHGDVERLIGFEAAEHPVALQLGGSDPAELALAARTGAALGYAEINLNVGCPSDRVQSGRFGACLMREPDLVGDCVTAMIEAVDIPVTVKCRIGVDDQEPRDALFTFVERVAARGVTTFIVHARKAWLKGLSPKENRDIPPLDYPLVRELKAARPDLEIILNGGLESLEHGLGEQYGTDGIMLGRAAYHTPWTLAEVDSRIYGETDPVANRHEAIDAYRPYIALQLAKGVPLHAMTRHMLGLFHGCPGARQWRRILSEKANRPGAGFDVLDEALSATALSPSEAA